MKISVITATYNSAEKISSAISSIRKQSFKNIEWIVVDGDSKDGTLSVIDNEYPGPKEVVSEKDKGIYDALNKGISLATGDVIGLLHSDDLFASEQIISNVVEIFQNENPDGVYGDLQYVSKDDTSEIIRFWKSEPYKASLLDRGWMPAHPTLFLKKEVYEKHGLFNLDYKIAADYDLMLRIFSDSSLKFHYLPEVITKMRVGGASNQSLKNIIRKSSEDLKALKANGIKNPYKVLFLKNFGKLGQFLRKQ